MRALATVVIAFGFVTVLGQAALAAESEALSAQSDARKKANTEADEAYRAATRGDAGPAAKVDPWATVRPAATSEKKPKHQP